MEHPPAQLPVIVVGGGLSGLSVAALLAREGHAVTLFEKAVTLGGRARTRQRSEFFFNQGGHAFYLRGPGESVLGELGVRYGGSPPPLSRALALQGNRLYLLPFGAASLVGTRLFTPMAKGELIRLLGRLQRMKYEEIQEISLQDWLQQHVQHPQVRQFFLAGARVTTYSNAPELLSAGLALSLLSAQVWYLDNGWQTLVDGLRQKVQEAGARIVIQARVEAIEVVGEGYRARLADGSSVEGSAVVLATDPATASALVLDGTHKALRQWAAQAVPSRAACFDLALRRLPRAQNRLAVGMDRPLYYSVHSASAHMAPEGSALVHVMKYLHPDEATDPEATRQEMEALMDHLQPGWRTEVVEQFFLPQMVASNAIIQARLGGVSGRPGPAVPDLPNLYVAGDWVGPEGELADACFASARSAARLIMARLAGASQSRSLGVYN